MSFKCCVHSHDADGTSSQSADLELDKTWSRSQKYALCAVLSVLLVINIQLVFLWRRRRQRLGDVVGLVVYCPMAYVPHGRGRTDTNVMKKIRGRVEKKVGVFRLFTSQWDVSFSGP